MNKLKKTGIMKLNAAHFVLPVFYLSFPAARILILQNARRNQNSAFQSRASTEDNAGRLFLFWTSNYPAAGGDKIYQMKLK